MMETKPVEPHLINFKEADSMQVKWLSKKAWVSTITWHAFTLPPCDWSDVILTNLRSSNRNKQAGERAVALL